MIPLAKEVLLWHPVAKGADGTKLDSPNRPCSFSQRAAEFPHMAIFSNVPKDLVLGPMTLLRHIIDVDRLMNGSNSILLR